MKHNLRCIGRLVRIRNGKLVTQRKVWAESELAQFCNQIQQSRRVNRQYAKAVAAIYADPKALERWQQRKWNEPSELKVHYI